MLTRQEELPVQLVARNPAGGGRKCLPGREKLGAWLAQLHVWEIGHHHHGKAKRLWCVLAQHCGAKTERTLPDGRQITVYKMDHAVRLKKAQWEHPMGPFFHLTFSAARWLWADKYIAIRPAVDGEWA